MAGLAELAAVMMDVSQRRLEVTANNVSNINTPGFRSRRVFQAVLESAQALPAARISIAQRGTTASLKMTGNALDIAISPPASLLLRGGDSLFPSASAQLRRTADGRLIDGMGRALQAAGSGDLILSEGTPTILRDGTVLVDGRPEARVGMFTLAAEGIGEAALMQGLPYGYTPEPAPEAVLHQGALIPADVDLAAEMVELTQAGRNAETGAKIFQIYDELLGKASSTLGSTGR